MTDKQKIAELLKRAKEYRELANRCEASAKAIRDSEMLLRPLGGKPGRPAKDADRQIMRNALAAVGEKFALSDLKHAAKQLKSDAFRRLFKEFKEQGTIEEKIRAVGRQKGLYLKHENGQTAGV